MIARDVARHLAVVSARLPVRHVARPRHRGLGRRRQPLPRFRRRHRGVLDRPRAPGGRARRAAGGRRVPAHLERLLARAHDGARRAPRRARADGRTGDELPLPVGHRVGRGGDQARALRHRPAALHRFPRRLPRPHDGLAVVHVEQVHAADGLRADHAGRHARAVSEPLPPALRRRRPGQRRCSITSGCCSSATCRRRRWPRSWSSRSRAKAATWCRRRASSPGCARSATSTASC